MIQVVGFCVVISCGIVTIVSDEYSVLKMEKQGPYKMLLMAAKKTTI